MANYNRRHLEKIMSVQKIWVDYRAKGVTTEWIYLHLIEPNYYIGRRTFYSYLTIPAKRLLKEMNAAAEAEQASQLTLF